MKKKLIYISLLLCIAVLALTTVSAKTMTSDDIPGRTYVIGTHMYDRETNGEYTGTLTTQYIMLGASSIGGDDIQKMLIYYKNPMGEWKNALTNEVIAVPESFDIKYHNGQAIEPTPKVQYGDANGDGKISVMDLRYINRYLLGYEDEEGLTVANLDVNGDGRITQADEVVLSKYVVGDYPEAELPEQPLGKTYRIEYMSEGKRYEIDYELEGYPLSSNQKPEDPIKVGYIFAGWYIDEECTTKFEFDTTKVTSNIVLYAKFDTPSYGDVDTDGEVGISDVLYINRYLAGYEIPDGINITNGDVNGDNRLTEADVVLLRKYLVRNYPEAKLPEEPLGKTYIIEYIVNGETYELDYELEGYPLYSNQKPKDPTKEGYTFEGWYTDEECTTKFSFETTKITSNLVLYAKFTEEKAQYGDVTADGQINTQDVLRISKYLKGEEIPESTIIENGDVNGDGRITEADVVLLSKYIVEYYPDAKLPDEPLGKTHIIEYISDDETYKIDYELEGQTLVQPQKPTKEGYTFEGWYTDEECTTKFSFETTKITSNLVLYAKFTGVKVQYGDVDSNGEVNIADATYLGRYLDGYDIPNEVKIENGDVNGDGKITKADVVLIQKYSAGFYPEAKLPEKPLGKCYLIEYVLDETSDFEIYKLDYELEGYSISRSPKDPTKEGYTFEGWYTDEECTTKFEFATDKVTTNLVLFAKFVEAE